jgi:glycogen(starch) synthase
VSPITGEECQHLLGRAPDLFTPNGLNIDRFDVGHDFQTLHAQHKEEIHRFVMGHFFPSYSFDLDRTLYAFTSGRFEPRNKGFDLALEAMARLNAELRRQNDDIQIVFFIVTARETRSLDPHALEFRGVLDELREVSERMAMQIAERVFRRSAAGEPLALDGLVDEYWRLRHRRIQHAFRRDGLPPLTTHVLSDPDSDPILGHLRALGLCNRAEDPVKVVYHPEFIAPVNPLWRMDYEHFVRGCHLGVFPSSYEPWGYTPLECVAMGVPAITSDLAGFGRFVVEAFPDHDDWGLNVVSRRGRGYHDAAAVLARKLLDFCRLDRRARIALRNQVELHSRAFDWARLGSAYHEAHDRALSSL